MLKSALKCIKMNDFMHFSKKTVEKISFVPYKRVENFRLYAGKIVCTVQKKTVVGGNLGEWNSFIR